MGKQMVESEDCTFYGRLSENPRTFERSLQGPILNTCM